MAQQWSEDRARRFWENRRAYSIVRDDTLLQKQARYQQEQQSRARQQHQEEQQFFSTIANPIPLSNSDIEVQRISDNIAFWIHNSSWTYCDYCNELYFEKLRHHFLKRPITKPAKTCQCHNTRYVIPRRAQIPQQLVGLTAQEIACLRPFDIHCGDYARRQHGYREKTGFFRLSPSAASVEQKIMQLADAQRRQKCLDAYNYLMASAESSYSYFVHQRHIVITNNQHFNVYDLLATRGIECALWPHLYPFTEWCDSMITGQHDRRSSKISFMTKVFSEIIDYATNYDLLCFQYDRWLFKTVSGAITSARQSMCSPARALDGKAFSPGYWQWQHRYLLDAVRQYGYPSLFITISPYEWSFPVPSWLDEIRQQTGSSPTMLAAYETLHIAHTLEQIVRGYMCGTSDLRWKDHLFGTGNRRTRDNVNTWFFRFEFQGRGTIHLHLLVWLKDIHHMQYPLIRADIPPKRCDLSFCAHKYQRATSSALPVFEQDTTIIDTPTGPRLAINHPAEAFAASLRAYIATILPTLRCHMDVQTTNGRDMLLQYVTSYVSKCHDVVNIDRLYNCEVGPFQAAYKHLRTLRPCEPEMWLTLSATKSCATATITKQYTPPQPQAAPDNGTAAKYRARPAEMDHLTMLEWLRIVNEKNSPPSLYKNKKALVGVRYLSPFKDHYFFQHLLMNYPHRHLYQLEPAPTFHTPDQCYFFKAAREKMPHLWQDMNAVQNMLEQEGHKSTFIKTLMASIASKEDLLHLCGKQVVNPAAMETPTTTHDDYSTLDDEQQRVLQWIDISLQERTEYNEYVATTTPSHTVEMSTDWQKAIIVKGKAGTGKTYTVCAAIAHCLAQGLSILIATPTGKLATRYRATFPVNVDIDTIHAAFRYPVDPTLQPIINWALSQYDLIVLDEISMVPLSIAQHIFQTIGQIAIRPILLVSGDEAQQQPFEGPAGATCDVPSMFQHPRLIAFHVSFTLTNQHRCTDPAFIDFLNFIRHWTPSQHNLQIFQHGIVVNNTGCPTDDDIISTYQQHPHAMFITMSRAACTHVNNVIVHHLFQKETPLGMVQCDDYDAMTPLFKGMTILLTENRDKAHGVVNGQLATVDRTERMTILMTLPNGTVSHCHPVTRSDSHANMYTCYPFVPGYAITICKCQGHTVDFAVLWFDIPILPPGSAYVALSRVRTKDDLLFLVPMLQSHFRPVERL